MKSPLKLMKNPVIAVVGLLTLNACLYTDIMNVENLRTTEINKAENPAFQQSLAAEYKKLALFEADEMYDTIDAGTFAEKGLSANQGARPLPERPEDWDLKFGEQRLEDARLRLAALMSRDAAIRAPQLAARAQANYDCWLEQVEEGWQLDHIAHCQGNFQQAVLELEKEFNAPQVVTFDLNETALSKDKAEQIIKIAEEAKRMDAPLASIVGYADSTGSARHNLSLSYARADEVAAILAEAGYPQERIAVSANGEEFALQKAGDNVSQTELRRVEITFYPEYDS